VYTELDLEAARTAHRINPRAVNGADTLPDFSDRIRRAS
jgi:hypothetical protein